MYVCRNAAFCSVILAVSAASHTNKALNHPTKRDRSEHTALFLSSTFYMALTPSSALSTVSHFHGTAVAYL